MRQDTRQEGGQVRRRSAARKTSRHVIEHTSNDEHSQPCLGTPAIVATLFRSTQLCVTVLDSWSGFHRTCTTSRTHPWPRRQPQPLPGTQWQGLVQSDRRGCVCSTAWKQAVSRHGAAGSSKSAHNCLEHRCGLAVYCPFLSIATPCCGLEQTSSTHRCVLLGLGSRLQGAVQDRTEHTQTHAFTCISVGWGQA